MTTKKKPEPFELPALSLRRILDLVVPHAATLEYGLPMLAAVHFETHGRRLYATATDRFSAGICWHDLDAVPGRQSATVPLSALAALRLVLGSRRRTTGNAPVRLHLTADGVDVSGTTRDGHPLAMTLPTIPGNYPKLRGVVVAALKLHADPASPPADEIAVNPGYLARFGRLRSRHAFLVPGPQVKPLLVHSPDDSFVGVLMTRRDTTGDEPHPLTELLAQLEALDG